MTPLYFVVWKTKLYGIFKDKDKALGAADKHAKDNGYLREDINVYSSNCGEVKDGRDS